MDSDPLRKSLTVQNRPFRWLRYQYQMNRVFVRVKVSGECCCHPLRTTYAQVRDDQKYSCGR